MHTYMHLNICMHHHRHTCALTIKHIYVLMYRHTHTYEYMHILAHMHTYIHWQCSTYALSCMHTSMHLQTHSYIWTLIYTIIHAPEYIHALAHTHMHTDKQAWSFMHISTCTDNTHIHIYRCKVGPILCESVSMSLSKKCSQCMSWWTTQIWLIVYILNVCMLLRESKIHRNIL